ncbi:MAG TPA: TIGR01777 family oxidoreductase, partial [Puia sp.]|nr:TIGR01777 family oxidoreductase [Puia sp.]
GDWMAALEGSTAVINLVGRSVNCRYTERNKEEIIASRVNATRVIGYAIKAAVRPPEVWINAGSAAIFGDTGEEQMDEASAPGEGFSPEVCKKWEAAFYSIDTPFTRKVVLRMGLVFQKDEGLLKPFSRLVRLGLGGKMGSGEQYMSWIHEEDFTGLVAAIVDNGDWEGIINGVSPYPVKNKDFLKALCSAYNIGFGLPQPAFLLRLGALLIGTEAELILSGRRVVSKVLEKKNFQFSYPRLEDALRQLITRSHF